MEIAEFLLARIAEDEAVARAAIARNGATWSTADLSGGTRITGATEFGNPRSYRGDAALWDDEGAMGMFAETATHVVRYDPARVLTKCAADRRIVLLANAARDDDDDLLDQVRVMTLRLLALPYADRPDYDPEWKV